jgi:DNA-binding MarR family transcriptional regulator
MITIDVSQLDHRPRSPHPGIEFRRTLADRRPARPVLRPNDGPGRFEERQRLADRQLSLVESRRLRYLDKTDYAMERQARQAAERTKVLAVLAETSIDLNQTEVARLAEITPDRCGAVVRELENLGFLDKQTTRNGRGGREVAITVTEAGLAEAAR